MKSEIIGIQLSECVYPFISLLFKCSIQQVFIKQLNHPNRPVIKSCFPHHTDEEKGLRDPVVQLANTNLNMKAQI